MEKRKEENEKKREHFMYKSTTPVRASSSGGKKTTDLSSSVFNLTPKGSTNFAHDASSDWRNHALVAVCHLFLHFLQFLCS